MTAAEAAHRLGVKPETLYAYVSRGLLRRHPASVHRRSLFAPAEIEALAGRVRHPNRSNALEVVIETELTALHPDGRLYYRGRDVCDLARYRSFESVAALLWDGDAHAPWELERASAELISAVRAALPAGVAKVELIPLAVSALAAIDPERGDRRPEAVRRCGARIFAGVLTILAEREPADRSAAARLWTACAPAQRNPSPAQLAALNAALVLLADHELAASTLAARVAASAWADPYRVVLAGLGPLGGALHGGAALAVEALLQTSDTPGAAFATLERALLAGAAPGFGHRVYRDRDPRADHLLARLTAISTTPAREQSARALLAAAESLQLPAPNADFALAATAHAIELEPAAASTIFTVARIAGLIAHAIEEYPHRLRFRPRATYVGEPSR